MLYSLSLIEFVVLVVTDAAICGAGFLAFRQWTQRETVPPVWFVVAMLAGAFVVYGLVARQLWLNADSSGTFARAQEAGQRAATPESGVTPQRHPYAVTAELMASRGQELPNTAGAQPNRVPLLILYCLAFWTVPVGYFTHVLRGSIGSRWVDRRTWTSIPIEDEHPVEDDTEFEKAKEFALSGDTIGALGGGRTYSKKRVNGCFVAARILEAEGHYEEAAGVLKETADLSAANEAVWAEATFRLGLIYDKCLERSGEAATCYQMVFARCPKNPYGEMASIALHRLCPEGDALLDALDAGFVRSEPRSAPSESAGVA